MTMNPQEYDLTELRTAARKESRESDLDQLKADLKAKSKGQTKFSEPQIKELLLMEAGADPDDLERPYLENLPDEYTARVTLIEWLSFALEKAGLEETMGAIDYYETLGWVSESVAEDLKEHARTFRNGSSTGLRQPLLAADHLISLVYIARLVSMK